MLQLVIYTYQKFVFMITLSTI